MGHYHFIFFHLGYDFISKFNLRYDYVRHNYCFYRNDRYKLKDVFIITRSSAKCWKMVYTNLGDIYVFKSFKKSKYLANYMKSLIK